ncbi:hypothetical protein [Piscinibacter sp. XHJ-5]|uniref:ATP-binding protein n=1 Tax=Piscinibacter sp. XHJ-5 TaxID=3037797 RepID=UPI002452F7FF|nr:hypothetical protein [Piscinibacter sp. XHJ-5]
MTHSQRRILWIDDSHAAYEQVRTNWLFDNLQIRLKCDLEYLPLHDVLHENGEVLSKLLRDPPHVLVLDWHEGSSRDIYERLSTKVSMTILVSWSRQDELRVADVYRDYPELEHRTLIKPFTAQQLAALIERPQPALLSKLNNLVHPPPPGLEEHLAIRYLKADLVPIEKSAGWRLGLNRPELVYSEQQIQDLNQGRPTRHSMFGTAPGDPEKFGPVQYVTQLIPHHTKGPWPKDARYFQLGHSLPEASGGIEMFGRSVDGIIELMSQAGFARARYYHLTEVPGLVAGPSFELIARWPDDPNRLPLPASREIDAEEREELEEFYRDYLGVISAGTSSLVYKLRNVEPQASHRNDEFWSRYVDDTGIKNRLEVPVFLNDRETEKLQGRSGDILQNVRGMFVLDRGNSEPIEDRHVRAVEKSLLSALRYFGESRVLEGERFEQARALHLLSFHEGLGKLSDGPDIEKELVKMAVHVVGLDTHGGVTSKIVGHRSAMYVRFDAVHQVLDVSCETNGMMSGFSFSLDQERFVVVRCARKALQTKAGEAAVPVFVPNTEDLPDADRLREEDWLSIPQCTPERMAACTQWLQESVKTIVAIPVMSAMQLLGVLVIRSDRAHEFTRRRVHAVNRVIDVALPYLERLRSEENRKIWDGLVMHEMRANITWAKAKTDTFANALTPAEAGQAVADMMFVLEDGLSLSTQFLQWLGFAEYEDKAATTPTFWRLLDEYGSFRSRSSERLRWHMRHETDLEGVDAVRLGRAIRVLIDNAFRYADVSGNTIACSISADPGAPRLLVCVTNPGSELEAPTSREFDINDRPSIASLPRSLKAQVGLTLVRMLCREVRGEVDLRSRPLSGGLHEVVATLHWPIAQQAPRSY